jgi:hypothetical protein
LTEESNPKATLIVADSVNSMVKAVHRNVDQEFLFVTIDKVRISLMLVYSDIEHSNSWHAPLGILATLLVVIFPTTSFQQWLTVKPEVWQAFFYFVAVSVALWLLWCFRKSRKRPSVDTIIEMLKRDSLDRTGSAT